MWHPRRKKPTCGAEHERESQTCVDSNSRSDYHKVKTGGTRLGIISVIFPVRAAARLRPNRDRIADIVDVSNVPSSLTSHLLCELAKNSAG